MTVPCGCPVAESGRLTSGADDITSGSAEDEYPATGEARTRFFTGGNLGRRRDDYPSMDSDEPPLLRLITSDDVRAVPARRPARSNLRWAIAVVGSGQLTLGLGQVFGVSFMKAVDGGHIVNESAA